jgi:hypothetical protein
MDNPETVAALGTEDTGRRQTKQIQTKKIDNTTRWVSNKVLYM